jgi:hypothetical protein
MWHTHLNKYLISKPNNIALSIQKDCKLVIFSINELLIEKRNSILNDCEFKLNIERSYYLMDTLDSFKQRCIRTLIQKQLNSVPNLAKRNNFNNQQKKCVFILRNYFNCIYFNYKCKRTYKSHKRKNDNLNACLNDKNL